MKILLVKMSSLGDVVHALPAVTDACAQIDKLEIDWVVEEAFADIPAMHPGVNEVFPIALRRWRRGPLGALATGEVKRTLAPMRQRYDLIIDAQGLYKSALVSRVARGPRAGFDRASAREGGAAHFYSRHYPVARGQHAVERVRALFAGALGYPLDTRPGSYGLKTAGASAPSDGTEQGQLEPEIMLLHGTTWASKHYPVPYWVELAQTAVQAGYRVTLPAGSEQEAERAHGIVQALMVRPEQARVLPRQGLAGVADALARCAGVVGVDTGLAHLAAALDRPLVVLYGPTDPALTGAYGSQAKNLSAAFACAPCRQRECAYEPPVAAAPAAPEPACFTTLPPALVWNELLRQMATAPVPLDVGGT